MFAGVIESKSHEGGFLVSFTGSSQELSQRLVWSASLSDSDKTTSFPGTGIPHFFDVNIETV